MSRFWKDRREAVFLFARSANVENSACDPVEKNRAGSPARCVQFSGGYNRHTWEDDDNAQGTSDYLGSFHANKFMFMHDQYA